MLPPRIQKTGFGVPTHRKCFAAIEHPGPVDALINFRREVLDFLVGKILPRREDAAQKNRRIDGGKFALLPACPGFHVDEMKEEAMLVGQIVGDESQSVANAIGNFRRLSIAAMVTDTK